MCCPRTSAGAAASADGQHALGGCRSQAPAPASRTEGAPAWAWPVLWPRTFSRARVQAWALMEARQGNAKAVRELLRQGLKESPRSAYLHLAFAQWERQQGNAQTARFLLRRGCQMMPTDPALIVVRPQLKVVAACAAGMQAGRGCVPPPPPPPGSGHQPQHLARPCCVLAGLSAADLMLAVRAQPRSNRHCAKRAAQHALRSMCPTSRHACRTPWLRRPAVRATVPSRADTCVGPGLGLPGGGLQAGGRGARPVQAGHRDRRAPRPGLAGACAPADVDAASAPAALLTACTWRWAAPGRAKCVLRLARWGICWHCLSWAAPAAGLGVPRVQAGLHGRGAQPVPERRVGRPRQQGGRHRLAGALSPRRCPRPAAPAGGSAGAYVTLACMHTRLNVRLSRAQVSRMSYRSWRRLAMHSSNQ